MKEHLLLLCMTYPNPSRKYSATVCMAGINEENEFRRIYPVPYDIFYNREFHKKQWISYDILEKGDSRKESYKIRPETIEHYKKITDNDLRIICKEKCSDMEHLWKQKRIDGTSLGIIKPDISKIFIKPRQPTKREIARNKQTSIDGSSVAPLDLLDYDVKYKFTCSDNCKGHIAMCLDTESGQLYRNIIKNTDDPEEIRAKMEYALLNRISKKDLYFMMGTHSKHRESWMIISLLYPPKQVNKSLLDYAAPTDRPMCNTVSRGLHAA